MEQHTFSQKLKRLEEVVAKLESPDVELEEGLKLLEEGVALHKACQEMLTQTQAKITKLLDAQDSDSPIETAKKASTQASKPKPSDDDEGVTTLFEAADVATPSQTSDDDSGLPF